MARKFIIFRFLCAAAIATLLGVACDRPDRPEGPQYLDPDHVRVVVTPGSGAGFGSVERIYGPPSSTSSGGTLDVLSLGNGGEIVIDLGDRVLVDGPGSDFIVHENPFYAGGDPNNPYAEVAIVAVSQDGTTYFTFSFDYDPSGKTVRERFVGFAGIDPAGDRFDLADVGLSWARFIRISDAGIQRDDSPTPAIRDNDDQFLDDPGNLCCGGTSQGFDLDAITLLHLGSRPK
ncbi:MAG: hypothetical protein KC609_11110 [Myxococcales bacterium]|nr:hypothetical protein [Myxococcales bacterium]